MNSRSIQRLINEQQIRKIRFFKNLSSVHATAEFNFALRIKWNANVNPYFIWLMKIANAAKKENNNYESVRQLDHKAVSQTWFLWLKCNVQSQYKSRYTWNKMKINCKALFIKSKWILIKWNLYRHAEWNRKMQKLLQELGSLGFQNTLCEY